MFGQDLEQVVISVSRFLLYDSHIKENMIKLITIETEWNTKMFQLVHSTYRWSVHRMYGCKSNPNQDLSHPLPTVVGIWKRNRQGKPSEKCPGWPLKSQTLRSLWLGGKYHRVDFTPNPGVKTQSPLSKPNWHTEQSSAPLFSNPYSTPMASEMSL